MLIFLGCSSIYRNNHICINVVFITYRIYWFSSRIVCRDFTQKWLSKVARVFLPKFSLAWLAIHLVQHFIQDFRFHFIWAWKREGERISLWLIFYLSFTWCDKIWIAIVYPDLRYTGYTWLCLRSVGMAVFGPPSFLGGWGSLYSELQLVNGDI